MERAGGGWREVSTEGPRDYHRGPRVILPALLTKPLRAVVIGGGAIGASCFYHLVGRGIRDTVLVEQGALGSGSTGRSAAVVETQYVTREKIALCARSIALFRRLEQDHGLPFVHHGYLRLGHTAEDLWAAADGSE